MASPCRPSSYAEVAARVTEAAGQTAGQPLPLDPLDSAERARVVAARDRIGVELSIVREVPIAGVPEFVEPAPPGEK